MSSIPDDIVERVKNEANIVDVVGDYVRLRRMGRNWVGLCPFHDDKKPSMHVEPVKGIFKCFACGEGGNVFTFLMKINGWNFPETVKNLANVLGIEVPEEKRPSRDTEERERLVAAMKDAARLYNGVLKSDEGELALAYFRGRGFTDETIALFGLGYAPESWDWLMNGMIAAGYSPDELEKSGLIIKRTGRDGYYDRFRGRAMFPVFEASGRLVGFGARRMGEDPDQPKYINSPETPLYNKSRVLYGLFQAKDTIRKEAYALMVEGYADVISLHQAGVKTAIATSGTALAREHAELISRFTSRVLLIFDSDLAGEKATEKGIDVLISNGLDVGVVRLPDGEDPDTFVRKYGADELRKRIGEARSFIEYLARLKKNRGDFDSPDRQAEAIRSLVATIALIPDRLKRELYVNKLASDYHLGEGLIAKELEKATGQAVRRHDRRTQQAGPHQGGDPGPMPSGEAPPDLTPAKRVGMTPQKMRELEEPQGFPAWELKLAQVLSIGEPLLLQEVFNHVTAEDFTHPLIGRFIDLILAHYVNQKSFSIDELSLEELSEEMRGLIGLISVDRETISEFWRENDPDFREPSQWKIARDCLVRLQQEKIDRAFQTAQEKLMQANMTEEESMTLFKEIDELGRRKQALNGLIGG